MTIRHDFLSSSQFQSILKQFYPSALMDNQVRWNAYREQLRVYSQAAEMAATATQREIVRPLMNRHSERFVCGLDRSGSFVKSPQSIDDKISRYLGGDRVAGQEVTQSIKTRLQDNKNDADRFLSLFFKELPNVMNDLARFRIVCNFITDAQETAGLFSKNPLSTHRIHVDPEIEDRIEADRWEGGASGHRAIHLRLMVPVGDRQIHVEVQLMTVLELGWDMKSHPLYEFYRQGNREKVSKRNRLKARAVSDALYVADVLFDELYEQTFGAGGGA